MFGFSNKLKILWQPRYVASAQWAKSAMLTPLPSIGRKWLRPVTDLCQPAPPHATHNGCPVDSELGHNCRARLFVQDQVLPRLLGVCPFQFITSAIYPAALTSSFSTVSPVSLQVVQAMSTHLANPTHVANTTHVDGGSGPAAAAAVAVLAVHTVSQWKYAAGVPAPRWT